MANLTEIIKYQRSQGKGVGSSLAGGIKERLKEKFDPRKMFNQKGLMVSLFPALKAYKAKTTKEKTIDKKVSSDILVVKPIFESIDAGTSVAAKNSMVMPSMHRDFNVMRQNVIKLVKLENVKPATKADMFFVKASEREKLYESEMQSKKGVSSSSPTRIQRFKNAATSSAFSFGIKAIALLAVGALIVKALEKIEKETLQKGLTDFLALITGSGSAEAAINRTPYSGGDTPNYKTIQISEAERELNKFKFKDLSDAQKKSFFESQFKSEGNKPGTIAFDQNNPGAMVYRDWMKKYGGEPGKTVVGPDNITRTFAKFPTIEKGREAQRALWETEFYSDKPMGQALRTWVTPGKTERDEEAFANYAKGGLNAIERGGPVPSPTVTSPPPAPVIITRPSVFPRPETPGAEVRPPFQTKGDPNVKVVSEPIKSKVVSYGTIKSIDNLILHHTGGHGLGATIRTLESIRNSGVQYATHYVIDRDGKVYQVRPDSDLLYHLGATKRADVSNENSIGVEIIAKDSSDFTPQQIMASKALSSQLQKKYGIQTDKIFGHGEVSPHKMASEGRGLAETIRGEFRQAEKNPEKKVSLSPVSSKASGENISLASARVMLEEELGMSGSVLIVSQNKVHTNTVVLTRAADSSNPVRDILRSQFG
jgi:hypothetical protein